MLDEKTLLMMALVAIIILAIVAIHRFIVGISSIIRQLHRIIGLLEDAKQRERQIISERQDD